MHVCYIATRACVRIYVCVCECACVCVCVCVCVRALCNTRASPFRSIIPMAFEVSRGTHVALVTEMEFYGIHTDTRASWRECE